jgi:hypothetical protein
MIPSLLRWVLLGGTLVCGCAACTPAVAAPEPAIECRLAYSEAVRKASVVPPSTRRLPPAFCVRDCSWTAGWFEVAPGLWSRQSGEVEFMYDGSGEVPADGDVLCAEYSSPIQEEHDEPWMVAWITAPPERSEIE